MQEAQRNMASTIMQEVQMNIKQEFSQAIARFESAMRAQIESLEEPWRRACAPPPAPFGHLAMPGQRGQGRAPI